MKILILAPGSAGDVLPLTGLATRLVTEGHDVAVAANERFRAAVTANSLEFRLLRGDPEHGDSSPEGQRWHAAGTGPAGQIRMARVLVDYIDQVSQDFEPVVRQGADLVLLNTVALLTGHHVTEGLGVPSAGVFAAPVHPTGDLPAAAWGLPNLTRPVNRALDRVALAAGAAACRRTVAGVRRRLALPPTRASTLWRRLEAGDWPSFYGFSPALLPRPTDWPTSARVTGTWWPATPAGWRPDPDLVAFLEAGPPPVFFGLGSRTLAHPERLVDTIRDVLHRTGLRGVVQSGWAGLRLVDDDVMTIGETPHEWLFARVAAVVHHCGAGTTAAGLRAGVPTVGLPVLADQPFWASRLIAVGASPAAIPLRHLTADRLATALRAATRDPRHRQRAGALSHAIAAEDGAKIVADAVPELR